MHIGSMQRHRFREYAGIHESMGSGNWGVRLRATELLR